jgi:hypothetical protein
MFLSFLSKASADFMREHSGILGCQQRICIFIVSFIMGNAGHTLQ